MILEYYFNLGHCMVDMMSVAYQYSLLVFVCNLVPYSRYNMHTNTFRTTLFGKATTYVCEPYKRCDYSLITLIKGTEQTFIVPFYQTFGRRYLPTIQMILDKNWFDVSREMELPEFQELIENCSIQCLHFTLNLNKDSI